jgi:hypothetical protein
MTGKIVDIDDIARSLRRQMPATAEVVTRAGTGTGTVIVIAIAHRQPVAARH